MVQGLSPQVVYLNHSSTAIRLVRPDGPRTAFTVFGSPLSRFHGTWAFGYDTARADALWADIPLDVDVVVTHTPPFFHCDRPSATGDPGSVTDRKMPFGCLRLRKALRRARPLLAVCGHVHEGRGFERVRWNQLSDMAGDSSRLEDELLHSGDATEAGELPPPGSKKQSLIDLTGKRHRKLDNISLFEPSAMESEQLASTDGRQTAAVVDSIDRRGQRRETCIVNAAVMSKSWPYAGGKQFNGPIVVDLSLPVWDD
jgi:hypothetical protein